MGSLSNNASAIKDNDKETRSKYSLREKTSSGKNSCHQVGTENPTHMKGSGSGVGFEPRSREVKGWGKETI